MTKWRKFLDFLISLTPKYWLMSYGYDEIWDKKLNCLLDKYNFTRHTQYTAFLGKCEVWVANHPYASFTPPYLDSVRPSRLTIIRAQRKLVEDVIKMQADEGVE